MEFTKTLIYMVFFMFPLAVSAEELTEITILASRDRLAKAPVGLQTLSAADLARSRVLTINEALRKIPGVFARDEEGFGLRPNIGIRGLNPARSSKVLLLEDGLPLTFAPYGDNSSYFHPALERFERIEVMKNSGQIAFGPQTIGGIINYISAPTPAEFRGGVSMRAGNLGLRELEADIGGRIDASETGWRVDAIHKHSAGSRENIDIDVRDVGIRLEQPLGETQSIAWRANLLRERSQVPYSGLTAAEFRENPRGNPFVNDFFDIDRSGYSFIHGLRFGDSVKLRTAIYHTRLQRNWWRQSSNSLQRPNDASDPDCTDMKNLLTTCGNEGRLRAYRTTGVEPRVDLKGDTGVFEWTAQLGLRHHRESQYRLQVNGDTPNARSPGIGPNAGLREDDLREVRANSGFVEVTVRRGLFSVTPGVRYEDIGYARFDRLRGTRGETSFSATVPGVAVSFDVTENLTIFAGMHRGFAPPRVEDAIGIGGASVDLDAESSWNREVGLRWQSPEGLRLEVSAFDMDFENQVVSATLAGGSGATLTNGGATRHRGIEMLGEWRADAPLSPYVRVATTWLRDARFKGERFAFAPMVDSTTVTLQPITGNRLPYAAEVLGTLTIGADSANGLAVQLEAHYVGALYADELNTVALSAEGQRGRIGGHAVWNATVNFHASDALTWFGGIKNAADRLYIADLSRGIVPGAPRQWQAGFEYRF